MKQQVTLKFNKKFSVNKDGDHVRDGLSSALRTGDNLWVAADEGNSLERLTKIDSKTFGQHKQFDLHEYLDLPEEECEIDIEGTGYLDHYLWFIGSHSLVRKKPEKQKETQKQRDRLTKIEQQDTRFLLARIPMVMDVRTGNYELFKKCPHPENNKKTLKAAQLINAGKKDELMVMLQKDVHLKPFLKIPGKDNGFDIEGLALTNKKMFIGLRGPVLRGWAVILEVKIKAHKKNRFKFRKIGEDGQRYRKHFLHLEGMGIRELRASGNDLLILAGPTMDLDGTISVFRWKNAGKVKKKEMLHRKDLKRLFDVPHGSGKAFGKDKAEGMALWDKNHVLLVFDSPTEKRKVGKNSVKADIRQL